MQDIVLDWRQAVRSLRRAPTFAIVALLTLTFSIGLSTSVFSLVRGILLAPLDIPGADRLVRLGEATAARSTMFSGMINTGADDGPTLADVTAGVWLRGAKTLQALAPMQRGEATVMLPGESVHLSLAEVGPGFVDVFPVTPVAGRLLTADDDRPEAPGVVVVSERFWSQRLGRRPDVSAAALTLDGAPAQVVGVLASAFAVPDGDVDIWRPSKMHYPQPGRPRMFSMAMTVIGRMRPGTSVAEVRAEGQQILTTIAQANPAFFDGTVDIPTMRVEPMLDAIVGPVKPALTMLLAGVVSVLLAACVNLASLLLSRNTSRQHDVAVRLALGATRWRIVRPLLVEQVLLGTTGAGLGGLVAWWILRVLPRVAPAELPRLANVRFDMGSLAFAAAGGLATSVIVGTLPAWRTPSQRLREFMTSAQAGTSGRGRSGNVARGALVACQIALAAALLVGASLIGRSLLALMRVDPGYRAGGVLTFQVAFPHGLWRETGRESGFFRDLHARLLAHPGVRAAGHTTTLPLRAGGSASTLPIEGRAVVNPLEWPRAHTEAVTRGYLDAVGTRLMRGRAFDDHDTAESEAVVLVNDVFGRRYFPGEDPIGRRLQVRARTFARVVGVVASAHLGPLTVDAPPTVLQLADQVPEILGYVGTGAGVALRVDGEPAAFAGIVRAEVRALEPGFPVFNLEPLDLQLDRTFAQPRFYAVTLTLFAALALSTAVLGLYGVLAYAVDQRRLEFGIRRALGADERHIVGLVARRAALLSAVGLSAGLAAAAGASHLVRTVLFGIGPSDPVSYVSAAALIVCVVCAASWQPARRALRIDPARALRVES